MTNVKSMRSAHDALVSDGFTRALSGRLGEYLGAFTIGKESIAVSVRLEDEEFIQLPRLEVLDDRVKARSVAHMNDDGTYCYARSSDNIFDRYDPAGAMFACLDMMREALVAHMSNDLSPDIEREFPQHWLPDGRVNAELTASGDRPVCLASLERAGGSEQVFIERTARSSEFGELRLLGRGEAVQAYLVATTSRLSFAPGERQPTTLGETLAWLDGIEQGLGSRMVRGFAPSAAPLRDTVFIEAPNGLVGVRLDLSSRPPKLFTRAAGNFSILSSLKDRLAIKRLCVEQWSPTAVFSRNLGVQERSLVGREIALIGCGTIGSRLAELLVHSGAGTEGRFVLMDRERLEPGNIGRHALGPHHVGENKAIALAAELSRQFPGASIRGENRNARSAFSALMGFDLVVDATGEEAFSGSLNHALKLAQRGGKPVSGLFVYLFGNAVAAQSLLVRNDKYACFRCLKPDMAGAWRYEPRRDPQAPLEVTGPCGEAPFIPYGAGGSAIAAGLACNAVLRWAADEYGPRLRTICIDDSQTKSVKDVNPPTSPACPECAND